MQRSRRQGAKGTGSTRRRGPNMTRQSSVSAKSGLLTAVVNSSIHPDTGTPVPLPFRMSAFVPTNLLWVEYQPR